MPSEQPDWRALLAALAAPEPVGEDRYGDPECVHCEVTTRRPHNQPTWMHGSLNVHQPTCAWVLARQALGAGLPPNVEVGDE